MNKKKLCIPSSMEIQLIKEVFYNKTELEYKTSCSRHFENVILDQVKAV